MVFSNQNKQGHYELLILCVWLCIKIMYTHAHIHPHPNTHPHTHTHTPTPTPTHFPLPLPHPTPLSRSAAGRMASSRPRRPKHTQSSENVSTIRQGVAPACPAASCCVQGDRHERWPPSVFSKRLGCICIHINSRAIKPITHYFSMLYPAYILAINMSGQQIG